MKTKIKSKIIDGQSLFEVVFVIGIVSILVTSIVSLSTRSIKNSDVSSNREEAARLAQEGAEWVRDQKNTQGWASIYSNVESGNARWCLNTLSYPPSYGTCDGATMSNGLFTRWVTFTCYVRTFSPPAINGGACPQNGTNVMDYTVFVSWENTSGNNIVNVTSRMSDY